MAGNIESAGRRRITGKATKQKLRTSISRT